MLDQTLLEQIIGVWRPLAGNDAEMARRVPNPVDLKVLLEAVFLASIKQEEGRTPKLRLVFLPDAAPENLPRHFPWIDDLPFKEPLPLSVETLRKLAFAFDQDATALAACKCDQKYIVIGALFYGRMTSRLEFGGGRGRPPALTLSTRVAGSVIISFGDSVVGRFQDGRFRFAKPNWMGSRKLVNHIIAHITKHDAYKKYRNQYWFLYRDCLERLYTMVARRGHGGTIIWMPEAGFSDALKDIDGGILTGVRWPGSYLAENVLNRSEKPDDAGVLAEYKGRLADYLDMVSQLAGIDGAVLIDDKLAPHYFGAHLKSEWIGDVREGSIGDQTGAGELFDTSRFGTRHMSAIRFGGAHLGCVVFVISEDGPVRAICRLDEDVLIWPDCLNTIFLDS